VFGCVVCVTLLIWDVVGEDMVLSTVVAILFVIGELEESSSELVVVVEMML